MEKFIGLENTFIPAYVKSFPLVIKKGDGSYLWDSSGKRYLDMMSAIAVASFGHNHPRLVKKLSDQASTLAAISRVYHSELLGPFAQKLCEITGYDKVIPMNTGSEAIETAIKVARKWAYTKKGVADNQAEIIVCEGNFHGRTLTAISSSSVPQYKDKFGPLTPGFKTILYNNVEKLRQAITPNTAAFIVEPIQGEAGIKVPSSGYLEACAEICRQNNVLLICDEIQTGMGRTGKFLACQHENVKPDAVVLGKSLGGGLLPVSAFVATDAVMDVLSPGDHGSTFGGNPLACAVALEALNILENENLLKNSIVMGQLLVTALNSLHSPLIKEVRGKGLLIGVEIEAQNGINALTLRQKLQDAGLLCLVSHQTTLRFAPALNISKQQIEAALEIIKTTFAECVAGHCEEV